LDIITAVVTPMTVPEGMSWRFGISVTNDVGGERGAVVRQCGAQRGGAPEGRGGARRSAARRGGAAVRVWRAGVAYG
jgi:hypothetical protein